MIWGMLGGLTRRVRDSKTYEQRGWKDEGDKEREESGEEDEDVDSGR